MSETVLTDKEALEIAARHGMKAPESSAAQKRAADFVRAVYREGRDAHVMRVDRSGRTKHSRTQDED